MIETFTPIELVVNWLDSKYHLTSYSKAEGMLKGKIKEHCISDADLCHSGHNHKFLDCYLLARLLDRLAAIIRELY